MTVASQVKETLANLKGTLATIETFAAMETDAENKAVFERNARRIAGVVRAMENRCGYLEFAEPQYKGL